MKIRKNANQQNFRIDTYHYTEWALQSLLNDGVIHDMVKDFPKDTWEEDHHYVIYARECKEVKVACIDGYYSTVVVLPDNSTLFVEI